MVAARSVVLTLEPRHGRRHERFARDLPFGATLIAPGPHALSPVGAGAAAVAVEIEGRAPCR